MCARKRDDPNDPTIEPDEPEERNEPATTASLELRDGAIVREASQPEVFMLSGNKKVWIPTPAALFAMNYDWADVRIVPDGTLDPYLRVNIPSSSPTPGSFVFPPNQVSHFPLRIVPNATKLFSQGRETQLVELYGWLRMVDDACGDGDDFHYALELDTVWAVEQAIDLNQLFRVGSIVGKGIMLPGFSARRAVALPLIEVELNSWGWHGEYPANQQQPGDWVYSGNCGRLWPFNHYQPDPNRPQLTAFARDLNYRGPYVRIAGALVTDSPHDVQHRPGTFFSRYFGITSGDIFEWEGSVPDWHPGVASEQPNHFARWTEIHPPDLLEVLPWKEPTITIRAVALCARAGILPGGIVAACEMVEFDLFPEALRPDSAQIAYDELRGPECFFPWGENENNGSWITVYDDHIHIKAQVCGGALGDSPGRFKALYRVWWEVRPLEQLRRTGNFVSADGDEITYEVEPNAVGAEIVEFQLCLSQGLTWEKRMNMPDGQGSAWDLTVKDNERCTTNALWAHQVLNGQSLTFSKLKFFVGITVVYTLPLADLGPLPPGTRVKFTWLKD